MVTLIPEYSFDIKVAQGVGSLVQRLVYTDHELVVSLSNSLKLREQEIEGRGTLAGRLMALFVGRDEGNTIQIDGMRLKQLSELSEAKPHQDILLAGMYIMNLEVFREMLRRARISVGPVEG